MRCLSLTPVLHKIPLASNIDPKVVFTNVVNAGKYLFYKADIIEFMSSSGRYYFMDKKPPRFFSKNLSCLILWKKKLKEFVTILNEENDNNVFMLVHFEKKMIVHLT
jgi:hypothetical protein